jgi:hypothetical protein
VRAEGKGEGRGERGEVERGEGRGERGEVEGRRISQKNQRKIRE